MHSSRVFYIASNRSSDVYRKGVEFLKNNKNLEVKLSTSSVSFNCDEIRDSKSRTVDRTSSLPEMNVRRFKSVVFRQWNNNVGQIYERTFVTSTSSTESMAIPEMPEARGLPLVGTTFSLIRAGGASKLHEYVDKRHKELGPVYKEKMGPVKAVFVSSPNEYRRIFRLEGPRPNHFLPEAWILYNKMRKYQRGLFFMEGDEWLHFRRIMNKLLLRSDSEDFMIGPCKEATKTLIAECNLYAKKGVPIPQLEEKLYQWSIEVMLAILVGSTWPQHRSYILSRSNDLATHLHKIFEYSGQLSLLPVKLAMNLKLPLWNKFVSSVDNALEIVRDVVKELIKLDEANGLIKFLITEGIRGDDLVRIVADLILAAGDTTAYSMQWSLFLLSTNPDVQMDLFDKLKTVKEEDVTQQPLLKGVIKEALRLYPTAPFLTRFLPEDSIVGGYRVAKGELVLMSLYTSGRDEMNFKNADTFSPERWVRNEKGDYNGVINPHASLPFALGARSCVGRKIAEIQLTSTIAELIKSFKIECVNGEEVKMILHLVSVPSQPIKLLITPRC